jgi:hypothetical protein
MRVILIIALLLQVSASIAQADKIQVITVEQALQTAFRNNPSTLSLPDRKKLTCDIKSAWYLWIFKIHKWQTMYEYQHLLGDLNRVATWHYQTGEIDLLEKSAFITKLADTEAATAILDIDIKIAQNHLKELLFVDDEIRAADSSLCIYQVVKTNSEPEKAGFQAFSGDQGDTLLNKYQSFTNTITIENKQLELDGLFIRLQFYNSFGLAHAEKILHTAQVKLNTEEIDYLDFTEKIAEAFEIKLDYLETLNLYNQTAIYLEYYAY